MTCSQCRDNFTEYLADGLPAEARRALEEHLGQCEECADDFAAFSATVGALRGLEPVAPPAGLLEQIGQAVSAADDAVPPIEVPRKRRWSWQHAGAVAVAASLLIGFATIYQRGLISPEGVLTSPQVAAVRSDKSAAEAPASAPSPAREAGADMGAGATTAEAAMGRSDLAEGAEAAPDIEAEEAAMGARCALDDEPEARGPTGRPAKRTGRAARRRPERVRPTTAATEPSPSAVRPAPSLALGEPDDSGGMHQPRPPSVLSPAPSITSEVSRAPTPRTPSMADAAGPHGERGPVGAAGPAGPARVLSMAPAPSRGAAMMMGAAMAPETEETAPGGGGYAGMPGGGAKTFSLGGINGPAGSGGSSGSRSRSPLTYAAGGMVGPQPETEAMDSCVPATAAGPGEPDGVSPGIEVTFMPPKRREVGTTEIGAIVLKADRAVPHAVVRVTPGPGLSVTNAARSGVLFSGPLRANRRTTLAVGLQASRPGAQRLQISVDSDVPEANAKLDVRRLEYARGTGVPQPKPATAPRPRDVSVVFDETPIRDAFMAISRQADVIIDLAPEVTGTRVNAQLNRVPVEAAVRILCDEAGCDVTKDGVGYRVTVP